MISGCPVFWIINFWEFWAVFKVVKLNGIKVDIVFEPLLALIVFSEEVEATWRIFPNLKTPQSNTSGEAPLPQSNSYMFKSKDDTDGV